MASRLCKVVLAASVPAALVGCDSPDSMRGATSLLQMWQPPSPLEAAEMAIDPWDADARARGTMLLANGYFGGEDPYHALYLERASDEDANVRAAALRGLSLHGQPEDVPLIAAALEDPNARVRLEACRALQRVHDPAAIDALIVLTRLPVLTPPEQAGENEPTIRTEAAHALGQYAEPRVIQPLISALDDRFLAVNEAARRSLRTLTGQDFGFDRKAWLKWYQETDTPFAGRTAYIYPAFRRDKFFWEYIPFVPEPPNETASTPVGFPPALERRDEPSDG
ncbi:MAG: HEAT repeat domain-containing protein [Phycisphaerales bacterium]|nr:HEAT repeat domain-containing protein [Phycisphaerales bacterium]